MRSRIAALGLALMLSGCAQLAARYELMDLTRAQVLVAEGAVLVTQEPLVVKRSATDGKKEDVVTWDLGTSGVQFAAGNGVTIDAFVKPLLTRGANVEQRRQAAAPVRDTSQVGLARCAVNEGRTVATCSLPRGLRSGFYAYTIRLMQGTTTLELDPTIMLE